MIPKYSKTRDNRTLLIREAERRDSAAMLAFLEQVSGETDNLSFGPGEFEMDEVQQAASIESCRQAENCFHVLAFVEDELAGSLRFSSRNRPRLIHVGEFGVTVKKNCWGMGIGSLLLDVLIDWAGENKLIKKINLRVRTDNHRAINLYVSKGFTVEGVMKMETYSGGVYHDLLSMALVL